MSTAATNTSRGSSWSDNEVKALIAIWGEDNIQEELDGAVRNRVIFDNIATKMREKGYERDWQQCRTKIKNLKKEYRQIKDHNGQTGRGRKSCKYYKELDNILGHRPASVPAVLLDTGTIGTSSSAIEDPQGDSAEEREELETNGSITLIHCISVQSYIPCLSTVGDDVQATAPLDSATVSQAPGTNSKEPGDKTDVCVCKACIHVMLSK